MSVLTAATDFPFENAQEIAAKLARYEEEFKYRYTEHDLRYDMTSKRPSRWYQVPTMHPWPPKKPSQRRRYEDWDSSSGHRRGGYRSGRGRSRGYDYRYRRDRPSGYYDEQLHGHWQPPSRSPRSHDSHRDMSPHRSPNHSGPPWGHGHSPSHPHTQHHSPHHKTSHDQHEYQPQWKSRSRSPSPWRRRTSPRQQHPSPRQPESSPMQPDESSVHNLSEEHTTEHTTDQEKDEASPLVTHPPSKPRTEEESSSQSETEGSSKPRPLSLNLSELAGLGQPEQKDIPTKNDVMDILTKASMGSNSVTSDNLMQVKREAQHQTARKTIKSFEKSKHKRLHPKSSFKSSHNSPKPTESHIQSTSKKSALKVPHSHTHSSSILHITHGETDYPPNTLLDVQGLGKMVESGLEVKGRHGSKTMSAASLLKEEIGESKKPHKRKPIIEESESSSSEEEELDVTTPIDVNILKTNIESNSSSKVRQSRTPLTAGPLWVRLDKTCIPRYSQTQSIGGSFSQHTDTDNVLVPQGIINTPKHDDVMQKSGGNAEQGPGEHDKAVDDHLNTSTEDNHTSYAVEYNPSVTTKVIIRTQQPEAKRKSKKIKKKKKKKLKHKSTRIESEDEQDTLQSSLKVKISLPPE